MSYVVEVFYEPDVWVPVRPSHSKTPYTFDDEEAARDFRRRWYPHRGDDTVRISKIEADRD